MLTAAERRIPRSLAVAVLVTVVVVASGFGTRYVLTIPGETITGESWLALLVAAAMWCGAALMVQRRATVAWLLTVGAVVLATFNVLGLLRTLQAALGELAPAIPTVWPWLVPTTETVLMMGAGVTAAYAARKRDSARRSVQLGVSVAAAAGWLAVAAVATLSITRPTDVDLIRLGGRAALGFSLGAALVGAARDLAGPVARAQQRLLDQPLGKRGSTIAVFGRLLRDELFPAATEQRRIAIEEERARLAADLHALVLPDLRRAAAAAAAAGASGDAVHAGLKSALADVEQLIQSRQSVVLEQFGLGAALEWLAERVEERSDVRVSIDEADTSWIGVGNRTLTENMAAARQRAAFRVALLALDNVVRHAHAKAATIEFGVAPRQYLAVTDDGTGIAAAEKAAARPGRGLVDMRAEAVSTGGNLEVTSSPTGTRVEIAWGRPYADDPRTKKTAST